METKQLTQHTKHLTDLLAKSFQEHGIQCRISDNLVIFSAQRMTAYARLFDRSSSPSTLVLQLDIILEIGLGREIIESSVGLGKDEETAMGDAWKNFLHSSFHVLLSVFFTSAFDNQVDKKTWEVDGRKSEVTISNIIAKGNVPSPLSSEWLNQLEEMVKNAGLPDGIHWVRLYYSRSQREAMVTEILLDNDNWTSKEEVARFFEYPKNDEFFSLRVFMVIKNGCDISQAVSVLAWADGKEDDYVRNELISGGLSLIEAEKAETFIPLAFGRVFLKSITTSSFSDEAVIHNGLDEEFTIDLNKEPVYASAYALAELIMAEGCVNKQHFQNIFVQSSEFNAYNQALLDGASPEDLDNGSFGKPIIYLLNYQEEIVPEIEVVQDKKKWWEFWKK